MSKFKKGKSLPLFIEKLVEILQDEKEQEIICWTSTQDSFNIKNIPKFVEIILPKYFKHNNFSSFIRQLNMYGFHKIRHEDGQNVYKNEYLIKGNRQLLKCIKRKCNRQKEDKIALYDPSYLNQNNFKRKIEHMRNQQNDLEILCKSLLRQNQQLMEENYKLLEKLERNSLKKDKNMEQIILKLFFQDKKAIGRQDELALQGEKQNSNDSKMQQIYQMLDYYINGKTDNNYLKEEKSGNQRQAIRNGEQTPKSSNQGNEGENHFLEVDEFLNVEDDNFMLDDSKSNII